MRKDKRSAEEKRSDAVFDVETGYQIVRRNKQRLDELLQKKKLDRYALTGISANLQCALVYLEDGLKVVFGAFDPEKEGDEK